MQRRSMRPMRQRFAAFLITLVPLLAVAAPAMALDYRNSESVVIGSGEVINDDVALAGVSIVVDGTINGDLFAFGNRVVINGAVHGNLITAADRAEIKGTVAGSVYGTAANLNVSGRIEGTLAAAGYSLTLGPGAYVGSSGLLAGGQVNVNGKIGRGALLAARRVDVGGRIGKDLKACVGYLRIGSGAVIEGPVEYASDRPATVEQGARTGAVAFQRFQAPPVITAWNIWWIVLRFLSFLPIGLAALALFPSLRSRYPEVLAKNHWRAPLAGLAALIAVPIGTLLLLITLIGVPFALITMALFPVLIYLSQVLVSWTVGKLLADRVEGFRTLRWPVIFLLGAFLTTVATRLPGVGCLVGFVALLYGLGGLCYLMIQRAG